MAVAETRIGGGGVKRAPFGVFIVIFLAFSLVCTTIYTTIFSGAFAQEDVRPDPVEVLPSGEDGFDPFRLELDKKIGPRPIVVVSGQGAELRLLDRITGEVNDYKLPKGGTVKHAHLVVELADCRYPQRQRNSESFAYLTIQDTRQPTPAFTGWMFANSPALSALDHARYDVWLIKCLDDG